MKDREQHTQNIQRKKRNMIFIELKRHTFDGEFRIGSGDELEHVSEDDLLPVAAIGDEAEVRERPLGRAHLILLTSQEITCRETCTGMGGEDSCTQCSKCQCKEKGEIKGDTRE